MSSLIPSEGNPEQLPCGLYLVGTPIGNLEDISLRAARILRDADLVLAEDTRHSGRLLQYLRVQTPMMSYHQFNAFSRREKLLERLRGGQSLALISDAGMPAISDPGADLVAACAESGIPVIPIPGPCAVVAAIAACGFLNTEFTFLGFLPDKANPRRKRLAAASTQTGNQVLYVAPHKLRTVLDSCVEAFGGQRRCMIARELTKLHEELWRGSLKEAAVEFAAREPRGEMTIVVEGADRDSVKESDWSEEDVEDRLRDLLTNGKAVSEATRIVVEESSLRKNQVYTAALDMQQRLNDAKIALEGKSQL